MAIVFNPFTGTFDFTGSGGGSSSNSFEIIQPDTGTAPTASSATDTLTLTSSDLTVNGNAGTKTITFSLPNATVIAKVLTGFSASAGAVAATDTILQGFNKVVGNIALKAPTASPTFTGSITFGNYHVEPSFHDFGNSGSSITLDLSQGSTVKTTLNAATPALTLSNGQTGASYVLMLVQDGSGSRVPSWVTTIDWGANGAPTLSTGAGKIDFINIFTPDGSTFYGMAYALGF